MMQISDPWNIIIKLWTTLKMVLIQINTQTIEAVSFKNENVT